MSVGRKESRYVTFLNSEWFLHYCSCPTVRDCIAVYPALLSIILARTVSSVNGICKESLTFSKDENQGDASQQRAELLHVCDVCGFSRQKCITIAHECLWKVKNEILLASQTLAF